MSSSLPATERRIVTCRPELRSADGEVRGFHGHAAVFHSRSEDLGGFVEQIAPGAFREAIARDDVRLLINHDPNYVLARNTAGTLRLDEDGVGLLVEADLAPTTYARDLAVLLERGDISQMSFTFHALRDSWDFDGALPLRTVEEVRLFDVAVVTYPAYPATDAGLRSLEAARSGARPPGVSRSLYLRRLHGTATRYRLPLAGKEDEG